MTPTAHRGHLGWLHACKWLARRDTQGRATLFGTRGLGSPDLQADPQCTVAGSVRPGGRPRLTESETLG